MKEFFTRLKLPTPKFWRKLRNFAAFLGTGFIVGYNLPGMPTYAVDIFGHGIFIAFIVAFVAQLAVYDKDKAIFENDFDI